MFLNRGAEVDVGALTIARQTFRHGAQDLAAVVDGTDGGTSLLTIATIRTKLQSIKRQQGAGANAVVTVRAKATKGFRVSAGAGTIILTIRTTARDEHFAFPVDDVPQLVSRMIAAHATATQQEGRLSHAIIAHASMVAIDEQNDTVTLSLMPTEKLHIPFSLTKDHASKIASALTKAVAGLQTPE